MSNEDGHDELKARRDKRDAEGAREKRSPRSRAESARVAPSIPPENPLSHGSSMAEQSLDKHFAPSLKLEFLRRRALDFIPPPDSDELATSFKIGDTGFDRLLKDLENTNRTGCVRAFSDEKKWRGALLLFRGRCVGCLYGSTTQVEQDQTEPAMRKLLSDMHHPETEVLVYDLSEEILLPMSSLFLGHPIERKDALSANDYAEYILSWLKSQKLTACLAVSFPSLLGSCLGFVHEGNFIGTFYVEQQKFSRELKSLTEMIAKDPGTRIEANVLTHELGKELAKFGFKLS